MKKHYGSKRTVVDDITDEQLIWIEHVIKIPDGRQRGNRVCNGSRLKGVSRDNSEKLEEWHNPVVLNLKMVAENKITQSRGLQTTFSYQRL